MKLKYLASALLTGLLATQAISVSAADMTQEQVEKIVHQYLVSHPEVLIEMSNALRAKQEAQQTESDKALVAKYASQLFQQADDPVVGNPKGSLTIVEFSDYNCGYCKHSAPIISELLKKDTDIRYIYKEFPILTDTSVYAAKAALAVNMIYPTRYAAFHDALMSHSGALATNADVAAIAKKQGLDWKVISAKLDDSKITEKLKANQNLAQSLNITGTPAFVIGDQLLRGAPQSLDILEQTIQDGRGK